MEYKSRSYREQKVYRTWLSMKDRCFNPKHSDYHNYGGRGITICERWLTFDNFFKDMGYRPGKGYSLDRINNELGYSPDNCRWATSQEQGANKRKRFITKHSGKITIGDTFGMLTVIQVGLLKASTHASLCRCACGQSKLVRDSFLLQGFTTYCGCSGYDYFLALQQTEGQNKC